MAIPIFAMLLRISVSVVLGAAVGYERERTGRPAGLRTHLLVSLASATFMLVSTQFVYYQAYGQDDLVVIDASRIAASVVTGVGFLGAGAILRTGLSIQGLTTAASLWLVAAVGLAAGGGMFVVAVTATVIALFSLVILRRVEGKQWRLFQRQVTIVFEDGSVSSQMVIASLEKLGASVIAIDYDRNVRTHRSKLYLDVHLQNQQMLEAVLAQLETLPTVRRVQVERPG
ncbi:MAG: MgtC/SapB family protein [Caldilinea sp. CFX5]|nr:MgtC/SapB family protein [Caldilinea sp. CFX5]